MKIEIITIGDEILIGQIVDTNSACMGSRLNDCGFDVVHIATVADRKEDIIKAFDDAFSRADIVLVTGGTGPTKDDVTKNVLLEYFGGNELVFHPEILENIEEMFSNRALKLNPLTETQAWIPDNSNYIMNRVGTAPCIYYERDGKVLFSMAGVPFEMKWIMNNGIIPMLIEKYSDECAYHSHFLVIGFSESALAEHLADLESSLPTNFKLAYLPHPGIVKLRITARGKDNLSISSDMRNYGTLFRERLGSAIISERDIPIGEIVKDVMTEYNLTLSTAESCTGGTIASMITAVAGSSAYFNGSVVSYANEVKQNVLGVSKENLDKYGAVSEQVVIQMVEGACRVCNKIGRASCRERVLRLV